MEDKDNLPLVVGMLVAVVGVGFILAKHYGQEPVQVTETEVVPTITEAPTQNTGVPTPLPYYAPQIETRTVYECVRDGQRVFSDSACGVGATVRTLSPANIMDARRPPYPPRQAFATPAGQSVATSSDQMTPRDCTPYEEEIRRIDARMRLGYTSTEGENLRDMRRVATNERDDCKSYNRLR